MTKRIRSVQNDQNIIKALQELPHYIEDKKHNLTVCLDNNITRSNETRFEHIAKKYHELKVRDIKSIPEGINRYIAFRKDKEQNETYCYYIARKGKDKGFIKVSVKLYEDDKKKAYIKSVFVTYRIQD